MKRPSKPDEQIPLRVFSIRSIVTAEGDLVVAGTPGTVYHWFASEDGKSQVMVRWDHYLFADEVDDLCERANTHVGLAIPVDVDALRWACS
jgi:hypothetical protein